MTTLIQSLQKQALDETGSLTALVMKAKLIAKKLNIEDFYTWACNELEGYNDINSLPDYRMAHGILQALNPYQGWKKISFPEQDVEEIVTAAHIAHSIAEIEKLQVNMAKNEGYLEYNLSGAQTKNICQMIKCQTDIRKIIPKTVTDKILCFVRNIILDWSMKLEEEGILGTEIEFSIEEIKTAKACQNNINITNFNGIIGDVNHSQIHQNINNEKFDLNELRKYLSSQGIQLNDLDDLEKCLQSDPAPTNPNQFGEKVSEWIAGMLKKSLTGAWKITIDTATKVLISAINKYYGL